MSHRPAGTELPRCFWVGRNLVYTLPEAQGGRYAYVDFCRMEQPAVWISYESTGIENESERKTSRERSFHDAG